MTLPRKAYPRDPLLGRSNLAGQSLQSFLFHSDDKRNKPFISFRTDKERFENVEVVRGYFCSFIRYCLLDAIAELLKHHADILYTFLLQLI
jgi:hypothetical protein